MRLSTSRQPSLRLGAPSQICEVELRGGKHGGPSPSSPPTIWAMSSKPRRRAELDVGVTGRGGATPATWVAVRLGIGSLGHHIPRAGGRGCVLVSHSRCAVACGRLRVAQ